MDAEEIIKKLCTCGYEAYLSGGAPRDLLLGEIPIDEDVVTNATPEEILTIFKSQKVNKVGEAFKVCIVDGVEVATYRSDVYFGGSHKNCKINVASTIEEDLARRDLSINSLAFCPYSGNIIDIFGGINDLKSRIIKFTGNPEDRIMEDPCRILRACRFLSKIEGTFDNKSKEALINKKNMVKVIAKERIQKEVMKVLRYRKPSTFFKACKEIDVLQYIFPTLNKCYGVDGGRFHNETLFEHMMICGDSISSKFPLLRLVGYLHDVGKLEAAKPNENGDISFIDHEKIGKDILQDELKSLKFSSKEILYICNMTLNHMRTINKGTTPKGVRKLLSKFSEDSIPYLDWLRLKVADSKANLKKENYSIERIKTILKKIEKELYENNSKPFGLSSLNINGNDLIDLGLKPGPHFKKILSMLLEIIIEDPEKNEKEKLIEIVKNKNF